MHKYQIGYENENPKEKNESEEFMQTMLVMFQKQKEELKIKD